MTDRISSVTKTLLTLSVFFVCATLGAALALFVGWPVAILAGIVGFLSIQQVVAGFARRRDKRAMAKELAHLRKSHLEFEAALHETRTRLGDLDGLIEERTSSQSKKIVSELKVLESLMREFAGKISRSATVLPVPMEKPQRGPASAYLGALGDKNELLETIRASLEENRVDLYLQPIVSLPQRKLRYYEAL